MNIITSKRSWLTAPVLALFGLTILLILWSVTDPCVFRSWFNVGNEAADVLFSPVEWMTLPLFGLIVPLVWLCPPQSGTTGRKCAWAFLWSALAVMAVIREADIHKVVFANIWPDVASGFKGTVFKMRFLRADGIPFLPKLFVLVFFIVFFVAVAIPLIRYLVPLVKGFFRFEPVAWSAATFGAISAFVLTIDRLPASLRGWGIVNLKAPGHEVGLALCKGLEEGSEMIMALLALLTLLQSYLIFGRNGDVKVSD